MLSMAHRSSLANLIIDEMLAVRLPRMLVLKNRRLGIALRSLQAVFICLAVLYFIQMGFLFEAFPMELYLTAVTSASNSSAWQCSDPEHSRAACQQLPRNEGHRSVSHNNELFLTTAILDESHWNGTGAVCGTNSTRKLCHELVPASDHCSCHSNQWSYVKEVENERFAFFHGYRAIVTTFFHEQEVHDATALTADLYGAESNSAELLTVFMSPTGSKCTIGGKQEWRRSEASVGIAGTLKDLLTCAGVSLDTDPQDLVKGGLLASSRRSSRLRTMGLSLELLLHYGHSRFKGTQNVCYITVAPQITILSQPSFAVEVQQAWNVSEQSQNLEKIRHVRGVAIGVRMVSSYFAFSMTTTISNLVSLMVVMHIPLAIVQLIALYGMGVVSTVYRSARQTKLNIFTQLHTSLAKQLLAVVGYRGLVGDWSTNLVNLPPLSQDDVLLHLRDVFTDEQDCSVLQSRELKKMVQVIFRQMDENRSGGISFREFVNACLGDHTCELDVLVRFFNVHMEQDSTLRLYLDDTDQRIKSVLTKDGALEGRSEILPVSNNSESEGLWQGERVQKETREENEKGTQELQLESRITAMQNLHSVLSAQVLKVEERLLHLETKSVDILLKPPVESVAETSLDRSQDRQGSEDERHTIETKAKMPSVATQLVKIGQSSRDQQDFSIMGDQHAAVATMTRVSRAQLIGFELRLKAVEEQLDQRAKKLEQGIRSLDSAVSICRQDMAAHAENAGVRMSQLEGQGQMLADRIILLELDVSSTPRRASKSNIMHTPQNGQEEAQVEAAAAAAVEVFMARQAETKANGERVYVLAGGVQQSETHSRTGARSLWAGNE